MSRSTTCSGERGIRTPGTREGSTVFKKVCGGGVEALNQVGYWRFDGLVLTLGGQDQP